MSKRLRGLVMLILGVVSGGLALLFTLGALLEFSTPGAAYAILCWVVSLLLIAYGIGLRRANGRT